MVTLNIDCCYQLAVHAMVPGFSSRSGVRSTMQTTLYLSSNCYSLTSQVSTFASTCYCPSTLIHPTGSCERHNGQTFWRELAPSLTQTPFGAQIKKGQGSRLSWYNNNIYKKTAQWFEVIGKEHDQVILPEIIYNMDETGMLLVEHRLYRTQSAIIAFNSLFINVKHAQLDPRSPVTEVTTCQTACGVRQDCYMQHVFNLPFCTQLTILVV